MKEYIVVYNLNSRGKKLTESYLTTLFEKHNLKSKIFMTSDVSEVDQIIEQHKDSTKYNYCAIGGDGTINSLIDCLLRKNLNRYLMEDIQQ